MGNSPGSGASPPSMEHDLRCWWSPKSNTESCRVQGGQDRGRCPVLVSRRGRRDTPAHPGPVTRAHVAAIWPACCWGSPPGALLLTGTSAFYSRQRIWERSGLRAGAESQPRRGAAPTLHPRDSLLDAGHHRCVTSLVQERGEASGQGSSWGCRQVPSRPGVAGDARSKGTAPSFLHSSYTPPDTPDFSLMLSLLCPHLSPFPLFFLSYLLFPPLSPPLFPLL